MKNNKTFFKNFVVQINNIAIEQNRITSLMEILIESFRNDNIAHRDIEVLILTIKDKHIEIKNLINDVILNAEEEERMQNLQEEEN